MCVRAFIVVLAAFGNSRRDGDGDAAAAVGGVARAPNAHTR